MRDELLPAPMLIKRAIEEARAVSKGKHRFEHDIDTNALLIGGEVEFYSIIVNLITNAVRYTPEGGVIRSEEHTSELQSLMRISYAVFCLKKKKKNKRKTNKS